MSMLYIQLFSSRFRELFTHVNFTTIFCIGLNCYHSICNAYESFLMLSQAFFINHHYKITSFIDPRLPTSPDNTLEQALIQQQQKRYTENNTTALKTLPRNQHPQTVCQSVCLYVCVLCVQLCHICTVLNLCILTYDKCCYLHHYIIS